MEKDKFLGSGARVLGGRAANAMWCVGTSEMERRRFCWLKYIARVKVENHAFTFDAKSLAVMPWNTKKGPAL